MKFYKLLLTGIFVMILSVNLFAQDKEMTKEEWQMEINRLTEKRVALTSELNMLKTEVANLKKVNAELKSYDDCMNELYAMLGAKKADVDNFRKQLADLTSKIDGRTPEKADRQAELDAMKKNKISALTEFFDKVHNQLQRKLDAWVVAPKEINYTVVKNDNLWNIAKKKDHYANPFAWPVIYKSNRDKIKNPDLIFPKQIFKIPNLTEEEKSKYDKIRRNYKPAPPTQTQAPSK
ncbi:MAG: peptidoglycan-binding protein LysM [Ignavibacteriae bacterium HGW-Ignavibacteriae-3]|nr:MAG: peptidoglycan-binding protein LysM [Ignavibacteriae bacterium HGW-Ignavibacteriae-3]